MRCIVTGAAGFIGSHLTNRLLAEGEHVIGVDCFTDYYGADFKRANIVSAMGHPHFSLSNTDLAVDNLEQLVEGVDVIFHLAAQPGVRSSWGYLFNDYMRNNLLATQRLLEALKGKSVKVIVASTSSVYGNAPPPMREDGPLAPVSPYGVTKLAMEHLLSVYRTNEGLNYTALRLFTVFGPRQRPDMAFHRFCRALILGEEITIYGDGSQTRDFTYIDDLVDAMLAAVGTPTGLVCNIGGGNRLSVNEIVATLAAYSGRNPVVRYSERSKGDADHTAADLHLARYHLGYQPKVQATDGLKTEFDWCRRWYTQQ